VVCYIFIVNKEEEGFMKTKEYSLRERKYARTKVGLMNAFVERLKHDRFDGISIKEICKDAEIAEGTFFNYFPEKIDVIGYYLHLITLKMIWKAKKEVPAGKFLPLIDSIFSQLSEEVKNNNMTYQIISVLLVQSQRPKKVAISDLEKRLAFPNCAGIEEAPAMIMDECLKESVVLAMKNGELPSKTNADDVVVSLMAIISGTLLAIRFHNSNDLGYHYMRQLQALWRGFGAREQVKGVR
jgi:hypothetical protein